MGEILKVTGLTKHFRVPGGALRALEDVTFSVPEGQTLGIVGESGCGKSTLARLLMGIDTPTAGDISLGGIEVGQASRSQKHRLSRFCQLVFQDPFGSLNPRMKVGDIVGEGLVIHGRMNRRERSRRVVQLLERVGLSADAVRRYPHAFSGGQRQRIAIARALALKPRVLIADEPVSALDVSVQAQILNLLADLISEFGLTLIIVSHDLQVIRWIADRVIVMYLGRIVEDGPTASVFSKTQHPYTRALIEAAPRVESQEESVRRMEREMTYLLAGEVPSSINPPSGCAFHPRCPLIQPACKTHRPDLLADANSVRVACHDVHGFDTAGVSLGAI